MIAIIGGGISGLALSHYLREAGVEHVLLEACETPGGVMRTEVVGGVVLDRGPQRMRLTAPAAELVRKLGLESQMKIAPEDLPLWVFRAGRLRQVPLTLGQALKTDLVSWRGKARMLAEPFTRGPASEESVEAFFVRKFGREAYESFLGPLYGGLYASEPSRMRTNHGLASTLQEFGVEGSLLLAALKRGLRARRSVPTVSFADGLGAFPRALAATARDSLRLAEGVERLEQVGRGWLLRLNGGEALRADRVVLALPAPAAARVLADAEPEAARRIGKLNYNALAVVHLQSSCDLRGLGYQVAFGEALETRGVTWNASMFGRDGVFTAYLGGMRNPRLVDRDDTWIGAVAREEFHLATGCDSRVLMVSRTAVPAWDQSWDALTGLSLPGSVDVCAAWASRPGIPGRLAQAKALAARLKGV